jgi:hypothetical protein
MEVVLLAGWIALFGYLAHRRQVRRAQAQTEFFPTELWVPEQPETEPLSPDLIPTQARVAMSKPVPEPIPHESWPSVGLAGLALVAVGVVVAMAILAAGLS